MDHNTASAEAEIRALIDARAAALRAKDAHAIVAQQAAEFTMYSLAPPLRATEADVPGLEGWFSTWQGPLDYEIRDLDVSVGGAVAFCHGFAHLGGTKVGGEAQGLWLRLTLGLRRIDGGWKITHEHESVPFYMDGSVRAAVDLTP
jgi:ketosteroid isomerase-like protein